MNDFLQDKRFDFVAERDKQFIRAFDAEMVKLGYSFGDTIGSGYCWEKYMLIYRKIGGKSEKVYARMYIREKDVVLRFFLSGIDSHRKYIESSSSHIKEVFVGEYANCKHCHNEKYGDCRFRKAYTIDERLIEKCSGNTFEFYDPCLQRMGDYISLFTEFYPARKR
ncbi:MAG: hypothetical protein QM730_01480 [Anaerolineales bacterium]